MGNILKHDDPDSDLTHYIVTGRVTADEIGLAIIDFYSGGAVTGNVLCDLSQSDLTRITAADVESLAHLTKKHAVDRPNGKTAVVAVDDFTFGLSRMYEANKEVMNLPSETRSFRSMEAAQEWLGLKVKLPHR